MYRQIENTKYEINREGDVRNTETGRILKQQPRGDYLKVTLSEGNVARQISVHRLVATAFCEKGYGNTIVDHIDRDKYNNNADNLRWCTYADNARNGIRVHDLPDYIYVDKYTNKKNGEQTMYSYRRLIDGKNKRLTSSLDINKVIEFKTQYEQ